MLSKIIEFVKNKFYDVMLFLIIALLVLLAFSAGYITAKYQTKEPIEISNYSN